MLLEENEEDDASEQVGGNSSQSLGPTIRRLGSKSFRFIVCAGAFFVIALVFLFNSDFEHANYSTLAARTRFLIGGHRSYKPSESQEKSSEDGDSSERNGRPCRIPQMDPWDEAVKPFIKRPKPYSCPSPKPLSTLVYPPTQPTVPPATMTTANATTPPASSPATLRNASTPLAHEAPYSRVPPPPIALPHIEIEPSLKAKYGKEKDGELKCCASKVTRGNVVSEKDLRADQSYSIGKCVSFKDTYRVDSDFTLVECTRGGKKVYTDMHSTIVPNAATTKKIASAPKDEPLPPSIVLLGLDSSSRLNIHRAAPKLMTTLEELGAIEMSEYNKVGDNTLPNLLPILTGVSLPDANGRNNNTIKPSGFRCWMNKNYTFDECPFIWKNLSRKGYVTFMGEDEPGISIFNFRKPGFREQPTDHYLRPFYVVAEKRLKKTSRASASWCYAHKATLTRVLEYNRSFIDTYERRAPFFSLLFITGIGHQNAADIELGDAELADFVRHVVTLSDAGLEEGGGGVFLAVFSDHGMRWGKLRQSPFGWFEERTPFLFIRPPLDADRLRGKDARQAVRDFYPSLVKNKNRLTSPFDFHFTLYALLDGKSPSSSSCTECYDLLHEVVPLDRTCAKAGIPDKWCACADEGETLVTDESVQRACSVAVNFLNDDLKDAPQCARLTFGSALTAKYRTLPTIDDNKKLRFLVVTFTTIPGEAVFEATLLTKKNGDFYVSSDLSRLNQYGNQSWCVDDADKKLYCYCS